MSVEKRTALILRDKIIGIFKSEENDIADYVYENYMYIGLSYKDISDLEFRTIYVEI